MTFIGEKLQRISQALERGSMLGQWAENRNNNLDALRFIGAVLVIFAHSFAINGLPDVMPPFYTGHYGLIGVDIFFIISGFLITQSYLRSQNPVRFVWARFLRIFPALIVVSLFLVLILGPVLTTLPLNEYFKHTWTLSYFFSAISLYGVTIYPTVLPGVFSSNPILQINGPLWTLQYEWSFYIVVLLLGMSSLLHRRGFITGIFVISLVLTYLNIGNYSNVYWTLLHFLPVFFMYFLFGVLAYLYRDHIFMSLGAFVLVVIVLVIGSLKAGFADYLFVFLLGYLVFFIGFSPDIRLSWLTKYGDFSYGLYIYGWPVQQTVFYLLGHKISVWLQIGISLIIALLFAMFSWHIVEKRMLKLKGMQFDIFASKSAHVGQAGKESSSYMR